MFPRIQFEIHTNSISGVLNLAYSIQKSTKQCGYLIIGVVLLRARSEKKWSKINPSAPPKDL
jgi:hypothetical protein